MIVRPARCASRRLAIVVASVALTALALVAPARAAHARGTNVIRLIGQQLMVAPGESVSFTVGINGLPDDASIFVSVYPRLAAPQQGVLDAIEGRIKTGPVGSPLIFPLADNPHDNGELTVVVPTVVAFKDAKPGVSVRMATPGIYPVRIEARSADDEQLAEIITFAVRTDDPAKPTTAVHDPLLVSMMFSVSAPPSLRPDGSVVIDDTSLQHLRALVRLLQTVPGLPLTIAVQPELLDALARSSDPADRTLVDDLAATVPGRQVLSRPYVHLDPATATRNHLEQELADHLDRGDTTLERLLPGVHPDRSTWLADDGLDTAGLRLLDGRGVHQLVLTARDLQTSSSAHVSMTGVVRTATQGDSPTFDAAVADDQASAVLAGAADPVLGAEQLLAKLIAFHLEHLGDPQTFGVVLQPLGGHDADPAAVRTLVNGLLTSPFLAPATVGHYLDRVSASSYSPLTPVIAPDLGSFAQQLAQARDYIATTSSMEVTAPTRSGAELLAMASASNIDDATRAAYVNTARAQLDEVRSSILPSSRATITLAGQVKRVPIIIHARSNRPVRVRMHLTSSGNKIFFPQNDQIITIENGIWKNQIDVEPRTNGAIAVVIQLVTPVGNEVVGQQDLDVRVVGLSGLGIVLSGGALLVLGTWWVQHLRKRTRQKQAAAHAAAAAAAVAEVMAAATNVTAPANPTDPTDGPSPHDATNEAEAAASSSLDPS